MPALPPRLSVEDGVYLERLHELRDANENVERKNADGITPERAIAWLRAVSNVAAVLATGSEKAAAHRLGLSHSTVKHHLANARTRAGVATTAQRVWILGPRLPEPVSRDGSAGR